MVLLSFLFFLALFVIIGVASVWSNRHNTSDYLLASQSVSPWLVALSAVATNNSGYMFIGMIGYTYAVGLSSVWLMVGWILGDFAASTFVHKRLRIQTERQRTLSYGGLLSNWHGNNYRLLRISAGVITLIFLGTYAAAQLNAGSKALHVLLGWDYGVGAIVGAVIVLAYCFAGGIRASIWTDAAQSFVMIAAMVLMVVISVDQLGGYSNALSALEKLGPAYMALIPEANPELFILGWFFAGLGVVGQPHIMVRFMAMDSPQTMGRVRLYYYSWFTVFWGLTICAGLACRLLIPEADLFDAELALPTLSLQLLPSLLVGLVLAGLFAATMSTADSQILSCTAAITRDLRWGHASYWLTKLATVIVTAWALGIALFGNDSVFTLAMLSWACMASAFAPLLFIYSLGGKVSERQGLMVMFVGLATCLLWREWGLQDTIYEAAPGILAGLFVYTVFFKKKAA